MSFAAKCYFYKHGTLTLVVDHLKIEKRTLVFYILCLAVDF